MRFIIIALIMLTGIYPLFGFRAPDNKQIPNFDKRREQKGNGPDESQIQTANQLLNSDKIRVKFDPILGTPRWIINPNGYLNDRDFEKANNKTTPKTVVVIDQIQSLKNFLDNHKTLFQYGSEIFNDLVVQTDYITPHNNVRTIIYQQMFQGLRIFNARLISHIDGIGRIAGISSYCIPSPQTAFLTSGNNLLPVINPQISPEQALVLSAQNIGIQVKSPIKLKQNENNKFVYNCADIRGDSRVERVWFPLNKKNLRLAYEVLLTSSINGEGFQIIVDANNGEILYRQGLTKYIGEATYRVFTNESPTPMSPGFPYPSTNQPPVVERVLVTLSALNTNASPTGWVYTNLNQTSGNNADAYLDRDANDQPDTPRVTGSQSLVFDFPLDLSKNPNTYGEASVVNLFYWVNVAHDKFYELGFTEETGNFQNDNFGKSGFGNDALKAESQDGDGYNNSNMTTPPDGTSPRMQMFIFTGPVPYRDGSLDAEVIIHEYTHGVSDRLVGGGPGLGTLQALGMGEGWSDFFALAMTSQPTDDIGGNYPMGAYIAYLFNNIQENYYYGIRRYPYSTNMNVNPLTFKDIDPTQASPHYGIPRNSRIGGSADEVHNIGEVWCSVLWDMRAFLIQKYGFSQGNFIAMRLIVDGMKYAPPNPNFLEGRDAILLADRLSGRANQNEIWRAFAKRGMGYFATSPESDSTLGLVEDFNMPDDLFATPATGFSSSGQIGGLFSPSEFYLTLTNNGYAEINWRASCDGILELSSYSGVLLPGGQSIQLKITFNSAVALLPQGVYYGYIYITNLNSGITQNRQVKLLVGQKDFFVEMFDSYDNDLDFMSITFTPDSSQNFYRACKESVTNFFTDPAGGSVVVLDDDSRVQVVLPDNMEVEIYGIRTNAIWIGANGEVSFAKGDTRYFYPQLSAFYEYPRVAPLYVDLNPATGGTVSWKAMPDRIAVTWENVPEYGRANRNSFQAELFTNGVIRITWLNIETPGGMAGLSAGGGIPQGLVESDFTSYPPCGGFIKVLLPLSATEGDGIITNGGFVIISEPSSTNLTIQLKSSDTTKLVVPSEVVIRAGDTSATFNLTIVDNQIIDGTQYPQIIASAPGFAQGVQTIAVFDNEVNTIKINLPSQQIPENAQKITGFITLSAPSERAIAVELKSSDTNLVRFQEPQLLFIPAGKTNATFTATIIDDDFINGRRTVTIEALMRNWNNAVETITIEDDETTNLVLVLPQQLSEGSGVIESGGWVYLDGIVTTNVVINLYSDNTNKIQVPQSVVIFSNEMEASFDIYVPDNNTLDGNQIVTLTASSTGFNSSTAQVQIIDNELPIVPYLPCPADKSTNLPLNLTLKWRTGYGEQIINGDFEDGSLLGWTSEDDGAGGWMLSDGGLYPLIYGELPKYSGNYSAWLVQYGEGRHKLYQDIVIPNTIISANLRWAHSIINRGGGYNANNYFKVAILDQSNRVLQVLYSTETNTPTYVDWKENTADLTHFRGQTIRLAFIEEDNGGNIFVGLDDISLILESSILPIYKVYLSTSNQQTFQLIGTTTNNLFNISNLTYSTPYFWRVMAEYEFAQINSPVWQFTTRGTNIPPSITFILPESFTIFPAPGAIELQCEANDSDGIVSTVIFYVNGSEISRVTAPPYKVVWTNNYPGKYLLTASATDNNGETTFSTPAEILVGAGGQTIIKFIPKGSEWRYLDDGSNQGNVWKGYYFDDSNWSKGKAPSGYGFNDISTTLNFGNDYNNKFITYYFRNQFTNNYQLNALILKLRRDDGAVVYINGYEVLRDNMPSTSISYTTLASSPVTGDDQFKYFTYNLTNVLMVYGKNVVAVEVHQASPDSSDLVFDMELSAIGNYPPTIELTYPTNNSTLPYKRPITIQANAFDKYGDISKVEFYVNSTKVGESVVEPYQFTINDPPIGYMSIYARAIDNLGSTVTSQTILVYVVPLAISNYWLQQDKLILQWEPTFSAATVETTTNLFNGVWLKVTNQVIYTNNGFLLIIPMTYPQQYYRLRSE